MAINYVSAMLRKPQEDEKRQHPFYTRSFETITPWQACFRFGRDGDLRRDP